MEKRNIVIIFFACVLVILFGFAIKSYPIKTAGAPAVAQNVAPITYTKEFTYLPSQKSMTLESFKKPTKTSIGISKYIIKNKKSTDVIADYEKLLVKEGWKVRKVTEIKNSEAIEATKGINMATIVPAQVKDDVELTIGSR